MKSAIVLGGAPGVWEEAERAKAMLPGALIVATNHAGRDAPHVDHWVSFHVDHFPRWIAEREAKGLVVADTLWTAERRKTPKDFDREVMRADNWAGSSGLLAVTVALGLGCERVICCGVPLDYNLGHYNDPVPWRDAVNYRIGWTRSIPKMAGRVRSMSGWTMALIGAPDEDWCNAGKPS